MKFQKTLTEIEIIINKFLSEGVKGRIAKFLLFQLWDAWRTSKAIFVLTREAQSDKTIPADSVESLTRKVLEHAIVSSFVRKHPTGTVVDRFLKTSAKEFEKSWKISHHTEDKGLPVKELPTYKDMAEDVGGNLYEIYQKLSYLAHPRSALPYSLVEYEYLKNSGGDSLDFFNKRINKIVPLLIELLNILKQNFLSSLKAK